MLTDPALLFALGVALAVLYLPRTGGAVRWARTIRKTLPVTLFALAALGAGAPWLLVAALGFSAIGDFALSRPGSRAFLAGMIAFALAHLAYIALMISLEAGLAAWLVVVVLGTFVLSTELWLRPHTGALKGPVRAYVAVIALMALAAFGLPDVRQVALWGALLFVLSDTILAIETFVLPQDHGLRKWAGKIVWVSYISAQIGLFWGLS